MRQYSFLIARILRLSLYTAVVLSLCFFTQLSASARHNTHREVSLTVNSGDYVDVADIADVAGFTLYVEQAELGINTEVCVRDSTNGVRLFLPMRKIYHFSTLPGVLSLKWPIYATPGLRVVLSAT